MNQEQITNYFNAEKSESLLFIVIGAVAIMVAFYFLIKIKQSFYNGMAVSLIAIALIQMIVGFSVYSRSDSDIIRVENYFKDENPADNPESYLFDSNKEKIITEEIPRMKTVMKNFVIYRYIEIALILASLILFFVFKEKDFLKGICIGLLFQSSVMLILDIFAEKRGIEYLRYLYFLEYLFKRI